MTNRVPRQKNSQFCNRKWKRKTEEGVGSRRKDKRERKEKEKRIVKTGDGRAKENKNQMPISLLEACVSSLVYSHEQWDCSIFIKK